jgi:hypothetical protein
MQDEHIAQLFRNWMDRRDKEMTTTEDAMWQAWKAGWEANDLHQRLIESRLHSAYICGNE